jgi:signal peptidase I
MKTTKYTETNSDMTETQNNDGKTNIKFKIIEGIKTILLAFILFLIVNSFVFVSRVNGLSMYPTYGDKDMLMTVRPYLTSINQKDIIVFYSKELKECLIKRVIGLPGDTVKIENQKVYVNNKLLDEPYINNSPLENMTVKVPIDSYFVMGDNRQNSLDSRREIVGYIPKDHIQGKILFRIFHWPQKGE